MKAAGFTQDSSMRMALPGIPGSGYADYATDVGIHVFHGQNHRLSLSPRGSDQEVPKAKAAIAEANGTAPTGHGRVRRGRSTETGASAGAESGKDEHGTIS
jgi:hypothetical protein